MAVRGIRVAPSTIHRWVPRYVPEFEKRWARFSKMLGTSWRVDETSISIKAKWHYLYRAVDRQGKSVDFLLRRDCGIAAAQAFLRKALGSPSRATQSEARWTCPEPSRPLAAATRASMLAERRGSDEQVFEQRHRARPSRHQASVRLDGRVQIVCECGHHDRRNRAGPSDS